MTADPSALTWLATALPLQVRLATSWPSPGHGRRTFCETSTAIAANGVVYVNDSGEKALCIVDPGIKVQPGDRVYDEGVAHDAFLRWPDGARFDPANRNPFSAPSALTFTTGSR